MEWKYSIVEQGSVERRKVKVGKRLRDKTQTGARRHCHYARSELTKTVGQRPPAQSRCRSPPAPIAEESGGSQSITLLIYHQHNTFYKQHNKMIYYCLQYSRLLTTILQMRNNKKVWEFRTSSHKVSRKLTRNRPS